MFKLKLRVMALAMVAVVLVAWTGTADEEEKTPSISDIMTKAHKGGDSLIRKIGNSIKTRKIEEATELSEELFKLGKQLGKNEPPMGTAKSWKALTDNYVKSAETLVTALKEKNGPVASKAYRALASSCKACHTAHR